MDAAALMQGTTKKHDIPINHLDFSYIGKCTDIKELEKILRVLRSREEGCYPDLERCCEEKIEQMNPNSRILRKDKPLSTKLDLDKDERIQLDEDIKSWTSDMKNMEGRLTGGETTSQLVHAPEDENDEELPPIRSGSITLTAEGAKSTKTSSSTKNPMPRSHREWDKVNIDEELAKVDEDDGKKQTRTFIGNKEVVNLPDTVDTKGLSDGEKLNKANREKDKGNEAFRSSDFKEAIIYYSRSISLLPTAASYNNRALALLKCQKWQEAIEDTNRVLKLEPQNVKALLRRGTAYKGLKLFDKASNDMNTVLKVEPNNKKAEDMLVEIDKAKQEKKKTGRRMKIEDVEGEDNEEESAKGDNSQIKKTEELIKESNSQSQTKADNSKDMPESKGAKSQPEAKANGKKGRRMQIEEVESDEEDESVNVAADTPAVNGHATTHDVEEKTSKLVNGDINTTGEKPNSSDSTEAKQASEPKTTETLSSTGDTAQGVAEDSTESKTGSNIKPVQRTRDSDQKSDSGDSDRSSPVLAPEVEEKGYSSDESSSSYESPSEGADNSSSTEQRGATEEVKPVQRPVFYMSEIPGNCSKLKEEATALFKSGQYGEAAHKYSSIITLLEKAKNQQVNRSLMYSNRAACYLKTGDLPGTVKDCTASLSIIPHSVKPLIRRASAYEHLERFNLAYIDYRHVLLLDSRVEQAHLGTKRCQHMLHQKDGPKWREKLHLSKVNFYEVPEIIGLDGKPSAPVLFNQPVITSQSSNQPIAAQISQAPAEKMQTSQSQTSSQPKASQSEVPKPTSNKSAQKAPEPPKLSPKEEFEKLKAEGNEFVKQSKFKEAAVCYSQCEKILPDQTVVYTNRALCYIRLNQAEKAEEDCSKALTLEKDNVKALFRRAQARKMLKRYRDGIEDINHLLKVDPKNVAAKKEMDLLKNYWREELNKMKETADTKQKKEEPSKGSKPRKRMVIEEVDVDEESTRETTHKGSKQQSKESKPSNNEQSKPSSKPSPAKSSSETKSSTASKATKQTPPKTKGSATSQPKKPSTTPTSQGLPTTPKTAPKLDKATPYEFISAWNALKKSPTKEPYYNLLKQIKPSDIKTVISNKLDGAMLNIITGCLTEHYLPNDELEESYAILKNLSTVPRFGTVAFMMSKKEKTDVKSVFTALEGMTSQLYSGADLQALKKEYSV